MKDTPQNRKGLRMATWMGICDIILAVFALIFSDFVLSLLNSSDMLLVYAIAGILFLGGITLLWIGQVNLRQLNTK